MAQAQSHQTLPGSLETLLAKFDITDAEPTAPPFDFMWQSVVEDGREKGMLAQAFAMQQEYDPTILDIPDMVVVAESSLKAW